MEYSDVKAWLDELVGIYKSASEKLYLNTDIHAQVCFIPHVFVNGSIDVVADIIGVELQEEKVVRDECCYYRYFFTYNDVEFSNARKERLESFAHRD